MVGQYNALIKHKEERTKVAPAQETERRFDWAELEEDSPSKIRRKKKTRNEDGSLKIVYDEDGLDTFNMFE